MQGNKNLYGQTMKYILKKSIQAKYFWIDIFFLFLIPLVWLLPPLFYKEIIDYISNNSVIDFYYALNILFIIAWIHIFSGIIRAIETFFNRRVQPSVMENIYNESFSYIHKHSYNFFSNSFTWALVKKINKLVRWYETIADVITYEIIPLLVSIIFICTIVLLVDIYIWLLFLSLIIIYSIIQYFLYKTKISSSMEDSLADSSVIALLSDTISNAFNILTFSSLKNEEKKFTKKVNFWRHKAAYNWYRNHIIRTVSFIFLIIIEIWTIGFSLYLISKWQMTIWTFVLIQIYLLSLIQNLDRIRKIFWRIDENLSRASEMIEILNTDHEIKDIELAKDMKIKKWEIEFKNINFSYNNKKDIFNNFNLKIKPWEKVAIVWVSWAWKSTLVKLLFRFFNLDSWQILIDGQNISKIKQTSLRRNISIISQEPVLFHRTLRENISYWKIDASLEDIKKASKKAYCHDFIEALPEKYESFVWERWIKLSWGERQRVAIARAILQNNNILVLDEATSSLDSQSEKYIQNTMDKIFENKTSIVIAHRLSTIMKMDRIIVLEKGKIVEEGTHEDLLKKSWVYNKLWGLQSWK